MFIATVCVLYPVYLLAFLILDRKRWDSFTRIVSTFNSLQCVYMVYSEYSSSLIDFTYQANRDPLFIFSGYLFVDGLFQLPDLYTDFSSGLILSIVHHVVGGFGIYLIANDKLGFFLGYYFALTEISTLFLNLSWFLRTNLTFCIFYFLFIISRISTIPILLNYLSVNSVSIYQLTPLKSFMCFYASYALIALNCIWTIALTSKFVKLCINTSRKPN